MTRRKPGAVKGRPPKYQGRMQRRIVAFLPDDLITVAELAGDGNMAEGVRVALLAWVDANWPAQYPGRRVEIWRREGDLRYAVLCESGRPVMAAGPLNNGAAWAVMAGETAMDWSADLADDINMEYENGDAEYTRAWPEQQEGEPCAD